MYLLSDYGYDLPEALIAQQPVEDRDASRLMHIHRSDDQVTHLHFKEIEALLRPGDLLVVNNTRVIPARLKGRKTSGGKVEVLLLDYAGGMRHQQENGCFQCECMIRASKSPKPGTRLFLGPDTDIDGDETDAIGAEVVASSGPVVTVRFFCDGEFAHRLKQAGEIPLPPYIKRKQPVTSLEGADKDNYQTVYASQEGAVAAPTAGLHFTEGLMQRLRQKGIEFAEVTLHVGYGTFSPVRVADIRDHRIHSEFFSISGGCADAVNRAKSEGRRVIAVGTTSVRTLEYVAGGCNGRDSGGDTADAGILVGISDTESAVGNKQNGENKPAIQSCSGMCDLYIYPGYEFQVVDALITNFHLPESTLLMLISAFYNREKILAAYQEAVEKQYRFFSYGDAMFIE